jgi:hypothetical protein
MTQHAHGTFEVTITPVESDDGIGRFRIEKAWSGDLAGTGRGLMLSAGDPTRQAAGYVALETFEGTLGGRAGGVAFQQLGVMRPGLQELTYLVVPGSGTGDLAGLDGTLSLDVATDGTHSYDLTYSLGAPEATTGASADQGEKNQ